MSSKEGTGQEKVDRNRRSIRRFLGSKWWLGIGAVVGAIGVIIAILPLIRGSDSSSSQTVRANNGNCIIQSGNDNTCNADQAGSSRSASRLSLTSAQNRLTDCRALAADAGDEASQLIILKSSISVDAPTGRVIGNSADFAAAYDRTLTLMQQVLERKGRFKSDGGIINVDPKLDGDLADMSSDLPNLHEAVVNRGLGDAQWNQLTDYATDFNLLAGLNCSID